METKACTQCGEVKSLDDYYGREGGYKASQCKKCHNKNVSTRARERWDNEPGYKEKQMAKKRAWYQTEKGRRCHANASWRSLYGILYEDYERMLAQQSGVCLLCGTSPESERNPRRHLDVDHDHVTGNVRGLLCNPCNLGLGKFREDSALLRKAADYLDNSNGGL